MTESQADDPFEHTRMTLGEHLSELRSRLVKGVAAVLVAFLVCWFWREEAITVVSQPYQWAMGMLAEHYAERADAILAEHPERPRTDFFLTADPSDRRLLGFDSRLQGIRPGEWFFFSLKICLYFALFLGAPVLLWQLWQFIAAGLYPREKRAVVRYFPLSLVAFVSGIVFGYFFMVQYAIYFLNRDAPLEEIDLQVTMDGYLTFVSSLCLAFGVVFQLPLVMTFLAGAGVVEPDDFKKYRGHFIVGSFIVAAILTPPDPFTQVLMASPMVLLYEVGLWGARWAVRRSESRAGSGAAPPGGAAS